MRHCRFWSSAPFRRAWGQDLHAVCEDYRQSPLILLKQLDALADPANKESPLLAKTTKRLDVMNFYVSRGQIYAYQGEMAKAVEQWEIAYRIASADVPNAVPLMEEVLGIGYLHKSEMDNDVYRHPGDRCIFPMRPDLHYAQTASCGESHSVFHEISRPKARRSRSEMAAESYIHVYGEPPLRRSAKIPAAFVVVRVV